MENTVLRQYKEADGAQVLSILNEVIDEGGSIPFTEHWDLSFLDEHLSRNDFSCVAVRGNEVVGFYTLHVNIPGRCSSGANATYLVKKECRGMHIGEMLVLNSIHKAKELGYRYMQFNGVVDTNIHARHLYQRCGFKEIGVVPKGFQIRDGSYQDMHIYWLNLEQQKKSS